MPVLGGEVEESEVHSVLGYTVSSWDTRERLGGKKEGRRKKMQHLKTFLKDFLKLMYAHVCL